MTETLGSPSQYIKEMIDPTFEEILNIMKKKAENMKDPADVLIFFLDVATNLLGNTAFYYCGLDDVEKMQEQAGVAMRGMLNWFQTVINHRIKTKGMN